MYRYRFLLSWRWMGLALLMICAAAVMVNLGFWQQSRYHLRSEINARIDAAGTNPPVALALVLAPPTGTSAGTVGAPPAAEDKWARVRVIGRYDPSHEILARGRTGGGRVGFEVVTPLLLGDGTAVLVDRGWLPAPDGGDASTPPRVPPAPDGEVAVTGRVHAPESRAAAPEPLGGLAAVRRIDPGKIAPTLPYAIYGAYLTMEEQAPPADPAFVAILPEYENPWMNLSYMVQWWFFSGLAVLGYVVLAVRRAHPGRTGRGSARQLIRDRPSRDRPSRDRPGQARQARA